MPAPLKMIALFEASRVLFMITSPSAVSVPVVIWMRAARPEVLLVTENVMVPVTVAVPALMFQSWLVAARSGFRDWCRRKQTARS